MSGLNRRSFTKLAAATAAAPLALSAGSRMAFAESRLRLFWWGNPERDKRTFAVVDLFNGQHPDIQVDAETVGWSDYWTKLATQAAGGNLPDVIQMDYRYQTEYARRGQLAALDDMVGDTLDIAGFDDKFLDSGRIDGKLHAVPWGGNSMACYYNTAKLAEAGVEMPDHTWTWEDFAQIARDVKAADKGYFGVADKGHWEGALEVFLRQRGKALYTEDGARAYDEEDVADFFGYWQGLRDEGLLPPPDVTFRDSEGGIEDMPLTGGEALVDFAHSNQLVGLQALNQDELGITMLPNTEGGQPGQYHKPAMLLSIAESTADKALAAELMGFLLTDLGANEILGVERGVPGDSRVKDHIVGKVDALDKKMIDYLAIVADNVSPLPPAPPKGAGEIDNIQVRLYPEVAFGRLSVADAASQYVREADAALLRG